MSDKDPHLIFYDEITHFDWDCPVIKNWLSRIPKMSYTMGFPIYTGVDWGFTGFRKEKNMNETSVENLIQASKDQNGRVYRTLQEQEKRIKGLENELNDAKTWYRTHTCPIVKHTALDDSVPNTQLFNRLVSRIGTKGILKMLVER